MNPDNPYAAPQTITTRVAPLELPLAEAVGRNHFPETSTRELQRLANWSIPIEAMSLLWGVFFAFAVLAFSIQLGTNPFQWYWGAAMLLAGLRMWGGMARSPIFWAYDLLLDAVFALVLFWASIRLAQFDMIALLLVGGVALVLIMLAISSPVAHLVARPLYGAFPQHELVAELGYRKLNRIE
jgi:hypothetical protein